MPRFKVVKTIVGKGGGAVGMECKILDTEGDGQVEYSSEKFNQKSNQYEKKRINGRWVDGFAFSNLEHARCMAAAMNLGYTEISSKPSYWLVQE